jgi:Ca-activated chloride channel family protein
MEITFTDPTYLWFLFSVPVVIVLHFLGVRYSRTRAMRFANFETVRRAMGGQLLKRNFLMLFIRSVTITLLILSLSGAVFWYTGERSDFDVVLAIDSSGSMLTDDYQPNRLEAAKNAATLFVDLSSKTEIGVVSFSGLAFIEQTLTDNFDRVREAIKNTKVRPTAGTAIGDAIITSSNILESSANPKVVILLTDGQSNVGVELENAIDYANEKKVTVHTIGIGTETEEILPMDEESLMQIANQTDGNYYKAGNATELSTVYQKLATSSEQKIPLKLSIPFLIIALSLLIADWGLQSTRFRVLPG